MAYSLSSRRVRRQVNHMDQAFKVECADCNFLARSHNRTELTDIAGIHLKQSHPAMNMPAAEIQNMIKPA